MGLQADRYRIALVYGGSFVAARLPFAAQGTKDPVMYANSLKEGSSVAGSGASSRQHEAGRSVADMLSATGSDFAASLPAGGYAYPPDMTDEQVALAQAGRVLQFIRMARDIFPAMRDLADHPGWEIILHIFIAGREGRTVNTTDLCERTGTWRPLAVRYIEMLFERGLIDRDVSAEKPDAWALRLTVSTDMRLQELLCGFSRGFREGGAQDMTV